MGSHRGSQSVSQPAFERRDWTYDDYLRLDDDTRYEIIEGVLEVVPAPDVNHQRIASKLNDALRRYVEKHALGETFFAPLDVKLNDRNVVQPDLLFVSRERSAILGRDVQGPPDLAVEIISPSSTKRDRLVKRQLYERFGVKEYWVVDPVARSIDVFVPGDRGYQLLATAAGTGAVHSRVLPGFSIDVARAFP